MTNQEINDGLVLQIGVEWSKIVLNEDSGRKVLVKGVF